MIDEELSAAVRLLHQVRRDEFYDRCKPDAPLVSADDRFMAQTDSPRAAELLSKAAALVDGAYRVPDPGGSIDNYSDALRRWMLSHREIDPAAWKGIELHLVGRNNQ